MNLEDIIGEATDYDKKLALRNDPYISRKELSKRLMISEDGVKYHLKKLKNKGLIERVGASRGGHWEVK